ncbi:alpha/beta fold hydrolase [Gulosibacter sediminis]|uniref:alpha/beta fold hydrolase n=1 Tax=Gulosibacter sediminis TaxID=1729695 RepID=UPI0024AD8A25|nr:alpha/beta hydrolase [Gulosibacter sediminis]
MTRIAINGNDLYDEVEGDGSPVVLLHGGYCSLESMRAQQTALAASHRVHAYERPGHGRTADLEGEYDYEQMYAELVAYLDAHDLEHPHLVGYSDGAILGLLLAMRQPERLRSLVAISPNLDPTAFQPDAGPIPALAPLEGEPERVEVEREIYERLTPDGPEHHDIVLDKLLRLWGREPNLTTADLAGIRTRTLIMGADRDAVRPDHVLSVAAGIPRAQLAIVPGTSHWIVTDKPELVTRLIVEFLDEVEA